MRSQLCNERIEEGGAARCGHRKLRRRLFARRHTADAPRPTLEVASGGGESRYPRRTKLGAWRSMSRWTRTDSTFGGGLSLRSRGAFVRMLKRGFASVGGLGRNLGAISPYGRHARNCRACGLSLTPRHRDGPRSPTIPQPQWPAGGLPGSDRQPVSADVRVEQLQFDGSSTPMRTRSSSRRPLSPS